MAANPCPACQGKRLKPETLAVTIVDKNIMDVSTLPVTEALIWVEQLGDKISPRELTIATYHSQANY